MKTIPLEVKKTKIVQLLKELPFINLNPYLIWDGDDASYKNEEHYIEFDNWTVRCKIVANKTISATRATRYQPPEYNTISQNVDVTLIDVWNNQIEKELKLTPDQTKKLETQIRNNIQL